MRQLILMRHAQAVGAAPAGGDRERALSAAGRAEAVRIGQALKARGVRPDLAMVSAARRTRETWTGVAEGLTLDPEPSWLEVDPALYNADARVLRGQVESAENRCETLILIAHNPGIHQLAFELLSDGGASDQILDRVRTGFAPATAAVFQVDAAGRCTYDGILLPDEAKRS
ncbi:histidine phosphatase family protein [Brevundimonas sp. BAL450]|jgi:phosphohistidine phosphatase|uniref:Phosphohistidine phosphatase SixA n=1 Tax=Brevundimonas abyssalis TAR-001 TaxID=1391729 RepID=A0A8E0TRP9_9CAUL|nr:MULTISPECIES: histidine phosphatase family protein [Brevundimonas]MBG7614208.1 histidine phosphatase family protein [Brevundimonas sp. BAL450]GAD59500.1 phosphohistidine phosphatase SixA [Brevundimonas abyssalis TAR-001]